MSLAVLQNQLVNLHVDQSHHMHACMHDVCEESCHAYDTRDRDTC